MYSIKHNTINYCSTITIIINSIWFFIVIYNIIHACMDRVAEKGTKVHVPQLLQLQVSRYQTFI